MVHNGDFQIIGALKCASSAATAPIKVGSGAPGGSPAVGDVYIRSDWPTIGAVPYYCLSSGVWVCNGAKPLVSDIGQASRRNNTTTSAQAFNKKVYVPSNLGAYGRIITIEADMDVASGSSSPALSTIQLVLQFGNATDGWTSVFANAAANPAASISASIPKGFTCRFSLAFANVAPGASVTAFCGGNLNVPGFTSIDNSNSIAGGVHNGVTLKTDVDQQIQLVAIFANQSAGGETYLDLNSIRGWVHFLGS